MNCFSKPIDLKQIITLGDKVRISDPCYDMETWCAGTIENVMPGKYRCFYTKYFDEDGYRIASIYVTHEDYLDKIDGSYFDEDMEFVVGVDSGQCGIYDLDYFCKIKENTDRAEVWYNIICDKTHKCIKNPEYVEFKDSKFWKNEYADFVKFLNNSGLDEFEQLRITLKQIQNKELTDKEKQYIEQKKKFDSIEHDYDRAYSQYFHQYKNIFSYVEELCAAVINGKCLVSSSGYGDGSYICSVSRDENTKKVVGILINYFTCEEEFEEENE